jgi:hypothetical protein
LATAIDAGDWTETTTKLVTYNCGIAYEPGDYSGNGTATPDDIVNLMNFVYKKGDPPAGGAYRADANCDGLIDLSDVIFVINYFYAGGQPPCY